MKKIILLFIIACLGFNKVRSQNTSVNLTWFSGLGSIIPNDDKINATTTDASGNIYITGMMASAADFDPSASSYTLASNYQAYLAKYDPSGNFLWAKVFTGANTGEGRTLGVDGSGNIYISGKYSFGDINLDPGASNFTLAAQSNAMFVAKYTSAGVFVWGNEIGQASDYVQSEAMNVNSAGDIILVGAFNPSPTVNFNPVSTATYVSSNGNYDGFVAKYNSSFVLQWVFNLGDYMNDYVHGVDVDASNNVYVVGDFQVTVDLDPSATNSICTSAGLQDGYVAKYSSSGALLWGGIVGGAQGDGYYKTKLDNAGDILVTGYNGSSTMDADVTAASVILNKVGSGANDILMSKYNPINGNLIWAKTTGGDNNVTGNSITCDQQNNIYLAGGFVGTADFDFSATSASSLTAIIIPPYQDVFLAKYDALGNYIYAKQMGGGSSGNEAITTIVDNNNNILLTGNYSFSVDVDFSAATNNLPTFGGMDFFMIKYSQCIDAQTPTLTATSLSMCANAIATLSIANGNLNSATTWVWSSLVCGSSTLATGITVTVSPLFATSYFVRGEGGCTNPGSCASATVSVTPSKEITGLVTTGASTPVPGYVILYRYENLLTKWDSVTYQNINALGNYTFTAVNSTSYILMALPNSNSLQTSYAPNSVTWKGAAVFGHGCVNNTTVNVDVVPLTNLGGGPGVLSGKITEGAGYGHKGTIAPGNPIGGLSVKGGKNPGGNIVAAGRTNSSGDYTLSGLPLTVAGEEYFIVVDIPGLDTNGTYRRAITTVSAQYTNLDFVVDSQYVNPALVPNGIREFNIDKHLVTVYPNPTKGIVYISFDAITNSDVEVELIDIFGRTITKNNFDHVHGQFKSTADLSTLSKGVYFVKIKINSDENRLKIILTE